MDIDASGCTLTYLSCKYNVSENTVIRWVRKERRPQKRYEEIYAKMMKEIKSTPRMSFHPSYGYATEEQIKKLNSMMMGSEYDTLMAQIDFQQRTKGKVK